MAAKGSKPRRGRGKPPAEPGAEPEMGPGAEPDTSPEAPLPPEGEGAGDDESSARRDESLSFDATEDAAPTETAEPATVGKPAAAETWGVTSLVIFGLAVVVVAAALAGVLMYAIADDTGRLDRQVQRLDAVAAQTQTQSSRLDAVEGAVSGLQSRIGELEGSVGDIRSSVEANSQAVEQMTAAIEDLRAAVNVPADGVAGEAVAQLQDTISALEERVASLEQGTEVDDLAGRIARLEEEISGLREQVGATIEQAEAATALGRAYAGLSERVAAGAPFAEELEAVSSELPGAPGLDVLRPLADDGIATVADLQARLGELSAALPADGDEAAATADGFFETMRRRIENMVTVRRADEADWPRAAARAEEALERGDVAGAIAEVEPVSGAAPDEIEAWLADARARRDAQAALDALSDAVLRQLAGRQ